MEKSTSAAIRQKMTGRKPGRGTETFGRIVSFAVLALSGIVGTAFSQSAPSLSLPSDNAVNVSTTATLSWNSVSNATTYAVQVSSASDFGTTVTAQIGLSDTSASITGLSNGSTYYWEVNTTNAGGTSSWSSVWSFTTIAIPPAPSLASPANGATNQPTSLTLSWGTVTGATAYTARVFTGIDSAVSSRTVAGLSASVSGLANDGFYFWEVNATNAGGTGAWSGVWSFMTIIATPGAPTLSSPTNGASNQPADLTLGWGIVNTATSYGVQVSTDVNFGSTTFGVSGLTSTAVQASGLSGVATYYWRSNAANAGGTGGWSSVWSFTTTAIPRTPFLASPASGATNQPTSLTLNWGTVTGAASYDVRVLTWPDSTVSSQTVAGLSASVSGLANSTTYYWEVNATNVGGPGGWSSVWSFTTIIAAPGAPTLASPTNGASNQPMNPTLSWGIVSTAASYGVQVSTNVNFGSTAFGASGLTSTAVQAGGLSGSTTYYWRANAANAGGGSLWSTVQSFTTIIGPPVLSSPTNNAACQPLTFNLSWGNVNGAVSYGVQVSTDIAFGSTVFGQSGLNALSSGAITGLSGGMTYYWEVNATSATVTGAWSAVWSFTTGVTQVIPLNIAWNMKSLNVVPPFDTAAVFGTDSEGFLFVKDNSGYLYCPYWGQDAIHYVQVSQGYQFYTSVPDTIRVLGIPADYAHTPIALASGWNMIAYLPPTDDSVWHAMASIVNSIIIVKNNSGRTYWPSLQVDGIGVMAVGEGYKVLMSAGVSFTYPTPLSGVAKRTAASGNRPTILHLPDPRHYASHANTGNNATLLAKRVTIDGETVPDSSEIGAFDVAGSLVGSGTVIRGIASFAVWGVDPQAKKKDGCAVSEPVTFKLWDGKQEYPLDYVSQNGTAAKYAADKVFLGVLSVPGGSLIKMFDLTRAYPNPFRGSVKISFDVPSIAGASQQAIEINVYDLKGSLVKQLASGKYQAGHYSVTWNCSEGREASIGSSVYIVRMKANNFDKRLKLLRVQ